MNIPIRISKNLDEPFDLKVGAVRLNTDMVVLLFEDSDLIPPIRVYLDGKRYYCFQKEKDQWCFKDDECPEEIYDWLFRLENMSKELFTGTCAEKYIQYAKGYHGQPEDTANLAAIMAQLEFKYAKEAAKADFDLFRELLNDFSRRIFMDRTATLSEVLMMPDEDIELLTDLHLGSTTLEEFVELMHDIIFVRLAPIQRLAYPWSHSMYC